jgi:hypothetical protein
VTTDAQAALPRATQQRGRCASSPGAAVATESTASHERRRPCGRRDTKRSDWRDGRAAANTSGIRGPAAGLASERGGDLAGGRAQRSPSGPACSPSGPVHAQREGSRPAIPEHGRAALELPLRAQRVMPCRAATAQRGCCPGGPGGNAWKSRAPNSEAARRQVGGPKLQGTPWRPHPSFSASLRL